MTITVEQFYNHRLWKEFSKTCKFRVPKGYHWPKDNPDDACTYIDEKTGGGQYSSCCYTSCIAWWAQLSEIDKADVLAEMDERIREMERLDPSYHSGA